MSKGIELIIKKSPVPILWIDTSVIIRMTKIRMGRKTGRDDEDERYLYNTIFRLVREGKLICTQGDQQEEILKDGRECLETQLSLSLGFSFLDRSVIKEKQLYKAMDAFVNRSKAIVIDYKDVFSSDPSHLLSGDQNLIVGVFENPTKTKIEKLIEDKRSLVDEINQLKIASDATKIRFSKQLIEEKKGDLQAYLLIREQLNEFMAGDLVPSKKQINQFIDIVRIYKMLSNKGWSEEKYIDFLDSDEWKIMPACDITAQLYSLLMTLYGEIDSGDPMDINHLAVALPFCQYVICDKKMRNLIKELGLNKKYDVSVFYSGDVKELIGCLNCL